MDIAKLYSPNYASARSRFREMALAANARLEQYPVNLEGREQGSETSVTLAIPAKGIFSNNSLSIKFLVD